MCCALCAKPSNDGLQGKSWGYFGPEHPLRRLLAKVVSHPYFLYLIFVLILASSVLLAFDNPNVEQSKGAHLQPNIRKQ